ncbi:MAG TPA: nickel pincer cofactor biosynthesis protein LarC [Thermomicrobiales bacterium]
MPIAYFDPFSGASGDMILGALIDAGVPLEQLRVELAKLDISGYSLDAHSANQHGLTGTRVTVTSTSDQPARAWREIRALIERSALEDSVKSRSLAIFERLAKAEASVHGVSPEDVHFHEVGAVDAIVDICGACIGLQLLGVTEVFSGPPRLGTGFVRAAHGVLPVPAPATAALLADASAPTLGPVAGHEHVEAELLTPTGAAILTTLARFERPPFAVSRVGYGFGARELPWPNALRLWIGEPTPEERRDNGESELLLETNIDDMSPQAYELLVERLFAAGALDVWLTPVMMKKGRPGTVVSALCPADRREEIEEAFILNSTTLGVRRVPIARTKAERLIETVVTRWGDVRIKLRGWRGRVIDVMPEHDDCARIARDTGVPLREVQDEARRIAEAYVGRRMSEIEQTRSS